MKLSVLFGASMAQTLVSDQAELQSVEVQSVESTVEPATKEKIKGYVTNQNSRLKWYTDNCVVGKFNKTFFINFSIFLNKINVTFGTW